MSLSSNLVGDLNIPVYTNNASIHDHYHQIHQYHQLSLQKLASLYSDLRLTNKEQQRQQEIPSENNHNSHSLFSFLYSNSEISTTTDPISTYDYPSLDEFNYNGGASEGVDESVQDAFVEGSHLWSLLVVGYCFVFAIGVTMNTVLLAALCGSKARALPVRNHLMVNLAAADLLVTAICVPISACAAASHACWPSFLVQYMCKLSPWLTRTPVTASTLSLALLSLDRWAAICSPRIAQRFRERRFVAMSMTMIWILASFVAAPTFWARRWDETNDGSLWASGSGDDDEIDKENNSTLFNRKTGVCVERWTNVGVHFVYAATYLGTAFVSPALIVAACHASVSRKLTTQLKVFSGATSGDRLASGSSRPRPKQVLIVARDPSNNIIPNPLRPPINNPAMRSHGSMSRSDSNLDCSSRQSKFSQSRKFIPCDPNSDDDVMTRMQIDADLESFRQMSEYQKNLAKSSSGSQRGGFKSLSTFRSDASTSQGTNHILKPSKRETSIIRAHRKLRKKLNVPTGVPASAKLPPAPILPTYSSQSFRSRRRAANLLAALAAVFVFCWLPYVVCALLELFLKDKSLVRRIIPFSLFLGHAHSAINPVVSWRLNRSAFVRFQKQSIASLLPEWIRGFRTCRLFCYSCTCPSCSSCCDKSNELYPSTTSPGQNSRARPPLRRAGTRYPGINENNRNPFVNTSPERRNERMSRNPELDHFCMCGDESNEAVPCCCCFCPSSMFTRRSSSPDHGWNRNTSTNELGAFHPKYLNRLPVPDAVSKCHTSHFFR